MAEYGGRDFSNPYIPANDNLLRCDKSTVEFPDPNEVFNYSRFSYFLKLCNDLERQDRIVAIRHAQAVPILEDFTDAVLSQEFCRIYGEMETENPKYAKLFRNYKEERLEEIAEWIEEEGGMINGLLADGIKIIDLNFELDPEEKVDIKGQFTPEEFREFSRVGLGAKSGTERFILPRKELTSVGEVRSFNVEKDTLNLAVFDPQIGLPTTAVPDAPLYYHFLEKLTSTLQTLIANHKTGICLSSFRNEFLKENKYEPDYSGKGYPDFGAMILDSRHIIFAQAMDGHQTLLYPTFLQGLICKPREYFWKIFHRLHFILILKNGLISVKHAFDLCEQIFGFKFTPKRLQAWGFSSLEDFAHSLFNFWPHCEIKLKYEHEITLGQCPTLNSVNSGKTLYMFRETDEIREELNSRKKKLAAQSIKNMGLDRSPDLHLSWRDIPSDYMGIRDKMDFELDRVFKNKDLPCIMTHYLSPTNFYVVLVEHWNDLELSQVNLAKVYGGRGEKSKYLKVNPAHLTKGILLVIKTDKEDDKAQSDFLRVSYVERITETRHKVISLDYGGDLEVEEANIMYLRRHDAYVIHAQAIPCTIYNVLPPKTAEGKYYFKKSVLDHSYDLLFSPTGSNGKLLPILVSFKIQTSAIHDKLQWSVRVCGAVRYKVPDVGSAIMKFIKENCETITPQIDSNNKSKGKSESVSKFTPNSSLPGTDDKEVKLRRPAVFTNAHRQIVVSKETPLPFRLSALSKNNKPTWTPVPKESSGSTSISYSSASSNICNNVPIRSSLLSTSSAPSGGSSTFVPSWIRDKEEAGKIQRTETLTTKPLSYASVATSSKQEFNLHKTGINSNVTNYQEEYPELAYTAQKIKPKPRKR